MALASEVSTSLSDFRTELYERYVSTFKGAAKEAGAEVEVSIAELDGYFRWCRHRYGPLVHDLPKDTPILELGCGPGDMLEFLRQRGFSQAEGIDLSGEQIEIARRRGLNARVADVFEFLEESRGKFGAIMAIDFFEHFSKDELMQLVPAIRDALGSGGVVILQTPNGEGLFSSQIMYGDLTHLTILTPDSIQQLFRLWGFEQFRFSETGPVPEGLPGTLRVLAWWLIRSCANLIRRIETGKVQAVWTENLICHCTRGADAGPAVPE